MVSKWLICLIKIFSLICQQEMDIKTTQRGHYTPIRICALKSCLYQVLMRCRIKRFAGCRRKQKLVKPLRKTRLAVCVEVEHIVNQQLYFWVYQEKCIPLWSQMMCLRLFMATLLRVAWNFKWLKFSSAVMIHWILFVQWNII